MSPETLRHGCQFLEWDSRFFGRNIGRVNLHRLTAAAMPHIFEWCRANRIHCLYFLADADHAETTQLATEHGFQLVDIRLTLEHRGLAGSAAPDRSGKTAIRPFRAADLPALRDMAGRLHENSRFFFDAHFSPARSRQMFEIWIERSCRDHHGAVFVAESGGKPAGYVACHPVSEQTGQIDLLGADVTARGGGVGKGLLAAALEWLGAQGVTRVFVVTQGRNVQAQRLYQRCGFATESLQLWYHRWFEVAPDEGRKPT